MQCSELLRKFQAILKTFARHSNHYCQRRRSEKGSRQRASKRHFEKERNMRTIRITSKISGEFAHLSKMKSWISKITTASAICVLSLSAGTRAYAFPGQETCSDSTLNGDYASTVSGQTFRSDGSVETRQGLVMMHFDGRGSFTQTDYVLITLNGKTSPSPGPIDPNTGFQDHESGTYRVNSDCTGNLEIHFAPPPVPGATGAIIKLFFVLGSHGDALRTVVVSVTPPSIVANDITGFTLHSEGSRLSELR
jgi:hypothetical protein